MSGKIVMDFELTQEQKDVVNATENRVLVEASAGSGKTACLVCRLDRLLNEGVRPSDIVAITFTNAAAENMKDRLGDKANGMFIGTIHSYANYLLLSKGIDTSSCLNEEDFDHLFLLVKSHPYCIRPIKHLLVDEAQDSTPDQFELFEMFAPENFFYVFDYRQSIYRWSGADPQHIIDMMGDDRNTVYHLTGNFRCGKSILDFAKILIQQAGYKYLDHSVAMRPDKGRVINTTFDPKYNLKYLKQTDNYGDWFILCRTNKDLDEMSDYLVKEQIPFDTFKRAQLTNKEINTRLHENTVKLLTVHTAKGLESKNVLMVGPRTYDVEEKCINYVAATRAKDLLVWTYKPSKNRKKKQPIITSWE